MTPPTMRAKLVVTEVVPFWDGFEALSMTAVCKDGLYPESGDDEDNTYAHYSPSATFSIHVANPALKGKIKVGEKYYVDFTLANPAPAAA